MTATVAPHARVAIVALVLALLSCSPPGRDVNVVKPVRLSIGVGRANPGGGPNVGVSQLVAILKGESLVALAPDGRPQPRLAERWNVSQDGLVWRFTLRENLIFHDGSPLAAEAVVNALTRLMDPRVGIKGGPALAQVQRIEADGPRTVVIHLNRPSTLLLDDIRETVIYRDADETVGCGPFLVESTSDSITVLRAFDNYYGGRPGIDRIEVRSYPTTRTAWAALMRGEVDLLHEVGPDALEFVQSETSVRVFSFLRSYSYAAVFNLSHPILRRVEVRRALNRAIDRRAVIEHALKGHGLPADGPMWPRHWAYDHSVLPYEFNPALADAELTAAGLSASNFVPVGTSLGSPSRLNFTCLIVANSPHTERMALVVQKQLYDVGVDMKIAPLPLGELTRRIGTGEFDAFLLDLIGGRSLPWLYRFWHSPGSEQPRINSGYAAADAALDQMRHARNEEELKQGVSALQRVLHDDPPGIFLCWDETARAVSRRFEVPAEAGEDILRTIWQWRPADRTAANTR